MIEFLFGAGFAWIAIRLYAHRHPSDIYEQDIQDLLAAANQFYRLNIDPVDSGQTPEAYQQLQHTSNYLIDIVYLIHEVIPMMSYAVRMGCYTILYVNHDYLLGAIANGLRNDNMDDYKLSKIHQQLSKAILAEEVMLDKKELMQVRDLAKAKHILRRF